MGQDNAIYSEIEILAGTDVRPITHTLATEAPPPPPPPPPVNKPRLLLARGFRTAPGCRCPRSARRACRTGEPVSETVRARSSGRGTARGTLKNSYIHCEVQRVVHWKTVIYTEVQGVVHWKTVYIHSEVQGVVHWKTVYIHSEVQGVVHWKTVIYTLRYRAWYTEK